MDFFTQEQLDVLDQSIRKKKIKIEILNLQYKILDTIEGECQSGSINIDATSDNRRSCDITFIVSPKFTDIISTKYLPQNNGLIWLDKYIKVYIGIDDNDGETVWFNKGMFMIDAPSYTYSASDNSLSLSGIDLISNLSDQRRGQLTNISTVIEQWYTEEINNTLVEFRTTLREAFVNVIKDFAYIQSYYIAPIDPDDEYLPEDVKYDAGSTIYDILAKLMEYLPEWEMFFDEDGVFTIQPIPDGKDDPLYPLDDTTVSAEQVSIDFGHVKNLVVVKGRTHDTDYFVDSTDVSVITSGTDTYLVLDIDNFDNTNLSNNITIGFTWLDNQYNPTLNKLRIVVNGTNYDYNLVDFESTTANIPADTFQPDSIVVIRYRNIYNETTSTYDVYWDYLGDDQSTGYAVNEDTSSPYYINADLTGENYYGGLTYCANHVNYQITLNNETRLTSLNLGTQITLMPNILNSANATLTIKNSAGTTLLSNVRIGTYTGGTYTDPNTITGATFTALTIGKWDGDNTIYRLTYKSINGTDTMVLDNRLQSLTYYLSGGEYENIYSNSLARQRARYELYLHSNLNDSINLSVIPNYTLDVNKRIQYTEKSSGKTNYMLIKSLSIPLEASGTLMDLNAMIVYPEQYYLTFTIGTGAIVVIRKGEQILESGDVIKAGDVLTISSDSQHGYFLPTITINGTTYTDTTYIVTGNTQIIATTSAVVLNNLTWEQIGQISQDGLATHYFNINDQKSFVDNNSVTRNVRIIGFNHDTITGTENKASITFEETYMVDTIVLATISSTIESFGWNDSTIRNTINTTIYSLLPQTLQNVIKTVDKHYYDINYQRVPTYEDMISEDKLFILSPYEKGAQTLSGANIIDSNSNIVYSYWNNISDKTMEYNNSIVNYWLREIQNFSGIDSTWGFIKLDNTHGVQTVGSYRYNYAYAIAFCI